MGRIKGWQHIYTRVERDQSPRGWDDYQTLLYSHDGLTRAQATDIESRLLFYPSESQTRKRQFCTTKHGHIMVSNLVLLDTIDRYRRGGLYLAHSILFEKSDFIRAHSCPFVLFDRAPFLLSVDQAMEKGDCRSGDIPSMVIDLPEAKHDEVEQIIRNWALEDIRKLVACAFMAEHFAEEKRSLAIVGSQAGIEEVLQIAHSVIPAELGCCCSFDTHFANDLGKPLMIPDVQYWAVGLPREPPPGEYGEYIVVDAANRRIKCNIQWKPTDAYGLWLDECLARRDWTDILRNKEYVYAVSRGIVGAASRAVDLREVPPETARSILCRNSQQVEAAVRRRLQEQYPPLELAERLFESVWSGVCGQTAVLTGIRDGFSISGASLESLYRSYLVAGLPAPSSQEITTLKSIVDRAPHALLSFLIAFWTGQERQQEAILSELSDREYAVFVQTLVAKGYPEPLRLIITGKARVFLDLYLSLKIEGDSLTRLVERLRQCGCRLEDLNTDEYKQLMNLALRQSQSALWSLIVAGKASAFLSIYLTSDTPPKPDKGLLDALSAHGCRLEDLQDTQYKQLISLFLKHAYAVPWSLIVKGKATTFLETYLSLSTKPTPDAALVKTLAENGCRLEDLEDGLYQRFIAYLLAHAYPKPWELIAKGKARLFLEIYLSLRTKPKPDVALVQTLSENGCQLEDLADAHYRQLTSHLLANGYSDPLGLIVSGKARLFLEAYLPSRAVIQPLADLVNRLSMHGGLEGLDKDLYGRLVTHLLTHSYPKPWALIVKDKATTFLEVYLSLPSKPKPDAALVKTLAENGCGLEDLDDLLYRPFITYLLAHAYPKPWVLIVKGKATTFLEVYLSLPTKPKPDAALVKALAENGCRLQDLEGPQYQQFVSLLLEHQYPEPASLIAPGQANAFLRTYLSRKMRPKMDAPMVGMLLAQGIRPEQLGEAEYRHFITEVLQSGFAGPLSLLRPGKGITFLHAYLSSGCTKIPLRDLVEQLSQYGCRLDSLPEREYLAFVEHLLTHHYPEPLALVFPGRWRAFLQACESAGHKAISIKQINRRLSEQGCELSDLNREDYSAMVQYLIGRERRNPLSLMVPGRLQMCIDAYASVRRAALSVEDLVEGLRQAGRRPADLAEEDYEAFIRHVLKSSCPDPLSFLTPGKVKSFVTAYVESGSEAIPLSDMVERARKQGDPEELLALQPVIENAPDEVLWELMGRVESPLSLLKAVEGAWSQRPISTRVFYHLLSALQSREVTTVRVGGTPGECWTVRFTLPSGFAGECEYCDGKPPQLVVQRVVRFLGFLTRREEVSSFRVDKSFDMRQVEKTLDTTTRQ